MIAVLFAVVFGGSAAVGVRQYVKQGTAPPTETVSVIVAAVNIPRGVLTARQRAPAQCCTKILLPKVVPVSQASRRLAGAIADTRPLNVRNCVRAGRSGAERDDATATPVAAASVVTRTSDAAARLRTERTATPVTCSQLSLRRSAFQRVRAGQADVSLRRPGRLRPGWATLLRSRAHCHARLAVKERPRLDI